VGKAAALCCRTPAAQQYMYCHPGDKRCLCEDAGCFADDMLVEMSCNCVLEHSVAAHL
jgi:hypothetical protein